MNVLEKEIEDMIWQGINENRPLLRKKGLWVWDKTTYHRQVDFGAYGICDIIGINVQPKKDGQRIINAHIIEIKKDEINNATFFQALRYAKGVARFVEEKLNNTTCLFAITLVGKNVDKKGEFVYLPDVFSNVALYTYKIDYKNGIVFSREADYYANNETFFMSKELKSSIVKMVSDKIKVPKEEDLPF